MGSMLPAMATVSPGPTGRRVCLAKAKRMGGHSSSRRVGLASTCMLMIATGVEGKSILDGMQLCPRAANGGDAGADIADARDESAMTSPALKVEFGVEEEGRRRTRLID